jgi:hypothetical protein
MAKKQSMAQPQSPDMTLEEAKAYRASLHKESAPKSLTAKQKRDAFKIYWVQNKKKYGMSNKLEQVLWLHLVSTSNDSPENFDKGLAHFGIKKV